MQTIEEMYSQFGPEVVREIKSQMLEHGGVVPLLKRLNLSIPTSLENQHDMLRNFIFQYGVTFFVKALKSNMASDDVERMKVSKLVSQSHQMPDGTRRQRSSDENAQRRSTDSGLRRRASDKQEGGASNRQASPERPVSGLIITPTYKGPDRRKGRDRRAGISDRRTRVDVVFKNRRYGGRERRKTIRRAADRAKSGTS